MIICKKWILLTVMACLLCLDATQAVMTDILYACFPLPFRAFGWLNQRMTYLEYEEYEELLACMDRELPDDVRFVRVSVNHEEKHFLCEYEIDAEQGTICEHMEEYLAVKELAQRALLDVGGVPRAYEIEFRLMQGSWKNRISFCNTVDEETAQATQGEASGGYHLIRTEIRMPCELSSLSVLEDVNYLVLENTVMDDLSGLAHMENLLFLDYISTEKDQKNDFMDQILLIKQRYPACRVVGCLEEAPEEPYPIRSLEDYQRFACCVDAGYEDLDVMLMEDLDLGLWPYTIPSYRGHFDGNGHVISGGTGALIKKLKTGGVVEDLRLEQVRMAEAQEGTGAIACWNYGEIRNCQVSGYVEGMGYVGGIAGVSCGLIEGCRNEAEVRSTASGAGDGEDSTKCYDGYGAGGIAGYCGTSKEEGEAPAECAIADCVNEGDVTARDLVAGICGRLEDRTGGGAPVNSVQDLIENFGFGEREAEAERSSPEEAAETQISHYSIRNCKNYGMVTAERIKDEDAGKYTQAAGICAELYRGCLYHCANLGTVRFSPHAPDRSDEGRVYTGQPMAVAGIMGFAPVEAHHVVDCVSLQGTVDSPMRHENIMEVTMEQMGLWEEGKLSGISNNWRFDLAEAVRMCGLEPLGIIESEQSVGKDPVYLCRDFFLKLPEGFVIREMEVDGVCYGLRIRYEGKDEAYSDYETWLIRRTADVERALGEIRASGSPDEWRMQAFIQKIYATLPAAHIWSIDSVNLPFSAGYSLRTSGNGQHYLENGLSGRHLDQYMREGDHSLGNVVAMPLEGDQEEGLEAKWIFVFTNHVTNIRPPASYMETVEEGFYLLDGSSACVTAGHGDSLWKLAEVCTGDGRNYPWLAEMNHMENSDRLHVGDLILLPDRRRWEERQRQMQKNLSLGYLQRECMGV